MNDGYYVRWNSKYCTLNVNLYDCHMKQYKFGNLDQYALISVNTRTLEKAAFYFTTSLFPSWFFNQARLHNQWNGSHVFSFKKLLLFSFQAYVPQILPVSRVAGWLLHSSHWQKEAVWMGEIVSFMAYVVTGGTKVWGELAQPVVPGRPSPAQLTNSAQQRENVWKSQREECETDRPRERESVCEWGKEELC